MAAARDAEALRARWTGTPPPSTSAARPAPGRSAPRHPQLQHRGRRARRRRQPAGVAGPDVGHELRGDRRATTSSSQAALSLFPSTLQQTTHDLRQASGVRRRQRRHVARAGAVRARDLGPALRAARPLFKDTTPVIARTAAAVLGGACQPLARTLAPAAAKLDVAAPALSRSIAVLNDAVQHARLPARRRAAELSLLGLLAGPHRRQPDRRPGRQRPACCRGCSWRTCAQLNCFENDRADSTRSAHHRPARHLPPAPGCPGSTATGTAPSAARREQATTQHRAMLSMVAFTASCIGLLIFLWISFGGSLPLAARDIASASSSTRRSSSPRRPTCEIAGVTVGHGRRRRARPRRPV